MKKVTFFAAIVAASLVPARAANLVLNPGFEDSNVDFTNWNVTLAARVPDFGDPSFLLISNMPNSGNNSADFGALLPGSSDAISQVFSTVAGQSYTFSFFLRADVSVSNNDGGTPIFDPDGNF